MLAGFFFIVHHESRIAPGNTCPQRERRNFAELVSVYLQRVDPQPMYGGLRERLGKGGILVTEEAGHTLEEKWGEGDSSRHKTIIMAL